MPSWWAKRRRILELSRVSRHACLLVFQCRNSRPWGGCPPSHLGYLGYSGWKTLVPLALVFRTSMLPPLVELLVDFNTMQCMDLPSRSLRPHCLVSPCAQVRHSHSTLTAWAPLPPSRSTASGGFSSYAPLLPVPGYLQTVGLKLFNWGISGNTVSPLRKVNFKMGPVNPPLSSNLVGPIW